MAAKLVTFKLDGALDDQGFRIMLEIGQDGDRPETELLGSLPPNLELVQSLEQWQQSYYNLKLVSRIKPKGIVYYGSIQPIGECRQKAQNLRDRLLAWLRSDAFLNLELQLREELSREDTVRILLRTSDPRLLHLPWHCWDLIERYPKAAMAFASTSFKKSSVQVQTTDQPKVKILAILGHSDGIDIDTDRHLLTNLPDADVTFLVEPNRQQINDQLWEQHWDILFFAGHSRTEQERGRIYINPQDSLTLEELKYGLRQAIAKGLQLAIFNSCDGLGLAKELERLHLPNIILMREPVPDFVAQAFLKYFLNEFPQGSSLYLATRYARERLQGLEDHFPCASWLPVIFQTSSDSPCTWETLQSANKSATAAFQKPTTASLAPPPQSTTRTQKQSFKSALIAFVAVTSAVLGIRYLGGFQRWELLAFDQLMRLRPPESLPQRVLIVEVTEADINTYGFPIPDAILAQAIQKLEPHRPRVIGLDIFRDRLTPGVNPLRDLLQKKPNLIALCHIRQTNDPTNPGIRPPASVPADRLGFSNIVIDPDGVVRRHLLSMTPAAEDPCSTAIALNTQVALQYLKTEKIELQNEDNHQIRLGKALLTPLEADSGPYRNLDHWGFQVFLNYASTDQFARRITLSDLLNHANQIGNLADHAVLFGVTAITSNATDKFLTPEISSQWSFEQVPGVVIQAQMLNQILASALDGRVLINAIPPLGSFFWIVGWSFLGSAIAWKVRRFWLFSLTVGGMVLVLYGTSFGLFVVGWWTPVMPAAIGLVLCAVGTVAHAQIQNTHQHSE